jgi:NAD(P)-dependent dehydrogenase (short-subunit alcohol dehydrogenase family)
LGDALRGRAALVTGASRGIGADIARRFAAEGAAVAVVARTRAAGDSRLAGSLDEVVADIVGAGGRAVPIVADLADPERDPGRVVGEAAERLGADLDVVVNNAAACFYPSFEDTTDKRLRISFEANVRAPWRLTAAAAPGMRRLGQGWVLNISSGAARAPTGPPYELTFSGGASVYGGTKAMLDRITQGAAAELWGDRIAVNSVRPLAAVETPGQAAMVELPAHRLEPMATMVEAALALCCGDPTVLTGRVTDSLTLLRDLDRPVFDLTGTTLVEGWQPGPELDARLAERRRPDQRPS